MGIVGDSLMETRLFHVYFGNFSMEGKKYLIPVEGSTWGEIETNNCWGVTHPSQMEVEADWGQPDRGSDGVAREVVPNGSRGQMGVGGKVLSSIQPSYLVPHPLSATPSLSSIISSLSDTPFPFLVPHLPIWYPILTV